MHATQLTNPFGAIHLIIVFLQFSGFTSNVDLRKPNPEEYEEGVLKIKPVVEVIPILEFRRMEQSRTGTSSR